MVMRAGDHELKAALERREAGELALPSGCSVTYDHEAINTFGARCPCQPIPVNEVRQSRMPSRPWR
jgi:hypothetical protein